MRNTSTAFGGTYGALSPAIRSTLANTFYTVSAMMGITALTGFLSLGLHLGFGSSLALFAASIAVLFLVRKHRNSGIGLALVALFAAIQGIALGPVLAHYMRMQGGVTIVSSAAALTAVATFACAVYASKAHSFSKLGAYLFGGLLVLIGAMLIGALFPIPGFQLAIAAFGALLFIGFLLYDINAVVSGAETHYISASISIYLDVLNLFSMLLRLLGIVNSPRD
ncbi:Bax inhibitor-1 family protein [Burkholderia cenocepacia]|uniref:Bax inhibitor-1 family protein n=1 Tax=Burkholderia cenocepacia TaxID=95486 RepID=UPI00076D4E44|nr:Bax inhibitor-1 family protein [Burkholderia cenocepacia]KWU19050.1 hypothetical protein AS149_12445 [Burkholderia cenocepacia]